MRAEASVVNVMIIDPDQRTPDLIGELLGQYQQLKLVATAASGTQAIQEYQLHHPELIFLETDLGDMSGFELIQKLSLDAQCRFVFVTHAADAAIKAFEFFAFDYIVKPLSPERLHLTLLKVNELISSTPTNHLQDKLNALFRYINVNPPEKTNGQQQNFAHNHLPVKVGSRIYFLNPDDVEYVEASGYYLELYAHGKKHVIRRSLKDIAEQLDPEKFIRIHRSVIINLTFMKEIVREGAHDFAISMRDGKRFKISRSYKTEVFERVGL